MELVALALVISRYETFPNATGTRDMQRIGSAIPAIEIADDCDVLRRRRPHRELRPGDAIADRRVRAEFVVQPDVTAFVEQKEVLFPDPGGWGVGRSSSGHGGRLDLSFGL